MFSIRRYYSTVNAPQKQSVPTIISKIRSQLLSFKDPKTHVEDCKSIFNTFIKDGNYEKFKLYKHIPDFNNLFVEKMNLMVTYENIANGNILCLTMLEYFLQHTGSFDGKSFVTYFDVLNTLRNLIKVEANRSGRLSPEKSKYLLLILESYMIVNPNIESYSQGDLNDLFKVLTKCPKDTQSYELANKLIIPIIENKEYCSSDFYRQALLDLLIYQKRYHYLEKLFQSLFNDTAEVNEKTHRQIFKVVSRIQDKKALEAIIQIKAPTVTLNNEDLAYYFITNDENLLEQLKSIKDQLSNSLDFVNVIMFQKTIMEHLLSKFDSYNLSELDQLVRALYLHEFININPDSLATSSESLAYYRWRTLFGLLMTKLNLRQTGDVTNVYCLLSEFLYSCNIITLITPDNYKEISNYLIEYFNKDLKNHSKDIKFLKSLMTKFENREKVPTLTDDFI
ncbi:uncharacterized protein HGUI_01190 [Hanseniaspora guilliermondii]|uniref:Uncharacterized protein n=1 Tax=Hanseniaspora guilliermondii TaxID=56406 RepID=A0A1L0FHC9_9ASCO|nr:uncharacterized protein HGUI_01190 [Hanseniaspora guilliermondii]